MEIVLDFYLVYPYNVSLSRVQELSGIWGLRFKDASTHSRIATLITSGPIFEKMFRFKPKKGEIEVPVVLESFIEAIKITSVKNVKK